MKRVTRSISREKHIFQCKTICPTKEKQKSSVKKKIQHQSDKQSLYFPWSLSYKIIFGCLPVKSRKLNETMDRMQGKSRIW